MSHMPGPGDSATWPPCSGASNDPRSPAATDAVEDAQNLIAELRGQLDRAETAVFRRDWETYGLAMAFAHDLTISAFQSQEKKYDHNTR